MDFVSLAQRCAPSVAFQTMAAIVKTESRFRPLAIGINGGVKLARQPDNKAEAVATANWLISQNYSIDLGLGQVNSKNLTRTGLSVEDAFDPCKNLAASASILHASYTLALAKGYKQQPALHAALSAYNTGSFFRGIQNGYVENVIKNFDKTISVKYYSNNQIPLISAVAADKKLLENSSKRSKNPEKSNSGNEMVINQESSTGSVMVY